jgi:hypothetical protein
MNWYKKAQSSEQSEFNFISNVATIKDINSVQRNFFFKISKSPGIIWQNKEEFSYTDDSAFKTCIGNINLPNRVKNRPEYMLKMVYGKSQDKYNSFTVTLFSILDNKPIFTVEYDKSKKQLPYNEAVRRILAIFRIPWGSRSALTVNDYEEYIEEVRIEKERNKSEKERLADTIAEREAIYDEQTTKYGSYDIMGLVRLTRMKSRIYHASVMNLFIVRRRGLSEFSSSAFIPAFEYIDLESENQSKVQPLQETYRENIDEVRVILRKAIESAKSEKKYVGSENINYIPVDATKNNWNFELNRPKNYDMPSQEAEDKIPQTPEVKPLPQSEQASQEDTDEEEKTPSSTISPEMERIKKLKRMRNLFDENIASNWYEGIKKNAQMKIEKPTDFDGYFSGNIPEHAERFIGTSSVDASQIAGVFGGTNEAIQLVNKYSGDFLRNIAFVFNFSKGGAFGVYVPALDRAIKTNLLKKKLEQKGYIIKDENNMLFAYPKDDAIDQAKVEEDIDSLWRQIESGGGTAIGLNMSGIISATNQNVNNIIDGLRNQDPNLPSEIKQILTNVLGIYHLAATIVHEATHSKGATSEGPAEAEEAKFRAWAQTNYVNSEYMKRLQSSNLEKYYTPLSVGHETIHAQSNSWYKQAQFRPHMSGSVLSGQPTGSDIQGRYLSQSNLSSLPDWSMILTQRSGDPTDRRLEIARDNRQYLAPDISQRDNSIEEQLRKQTRMDSRPNVKLIMEELLEPSRDESIGYTSLEMLLENKRPKPLMIPITENLKIENIKAFSYDPFKKEARKAGDRFLFGWFNNLDISDGSTIPGLSDRVMAWDDRDEDFAWSDKEIRKQPRYNPEYDVKGFYYRWIEPRFRPQLFDDMTRDYSHTTPALRFAQKGQLDKEIIDILKILRTIEYSILNNKIKASRIVTNKGFSDFIIKMMPKDGIRVNTYDIPPKTIGDWEDVCAIWLFSEELRDTLIDDCESYFQNNEVKEELKNIVEKIIGIKEKRESNIKSIVSNIKHICKELEYSNFYIIGDLPRRIYLNKDFNINKLEFIANNPDVCQKIGYALMEKLGVSGEDIYESARFGLSFVYKGIQLDFSKSAHYPKLNKLTEELNEEHLKNSLVRSACNRDFTINTLALNICDNNIIDILGRAVEDINNNTLETVLDANEVVKLNPMIIVRAIKYNIEGYNISEDLMVAIISNSNLLFDEKYRIYINENISTLFNCKDGEELRDILKKFRLEKLIGD